MTTPSTITRLPLSVRSEIASLRENGKTVSEILAHLKQMKLPISRSAVGRHVKKLEDVAEQIMRSRIIADAVVARLTEGTETKAARANIEIMHAVISRLALSEEDDGEQVITPREAALLSQSLVHLTRAAKTDAEAEVNARARKKPRDPNTPSDETLNADAASRALDVLGLTP